MKAGRPGSCRAGRGRAGNGRCCTLGLAGAGAATGSTISYRGCLDCCPLCSTMSWNEGSQEPSTQASAIITQSR